MNFAAVTTLEYVGAGLLGLFALGTAVAVKIPIEKALIVAAAVAGGVVIIQAVSANLDQPAT